MTEPIFMKLGIYIAAPKPISATQLKIFPTSVIPTSQPLILLSSLKEGAV
jgi:hypothetical protein